MPSPSHSAAMISNKQSLSEFAADCSERVGKHLEAILPSAQITPAQLHQAMRYALFNGGKRVRPLLVYAAGLACNGTMDALDDAACAVELIHSYSLVHDDLPAMDNDDLRRGKPTCHNVYGVAMAILVGDALQSLAFQLLSRESQHPDPEKQLQMIGILARASGSRGMAGGQALDIEAIGAEMNLPELEIMHIHKTGALIRSSVQLGALCSGASAAQRKHLDHYAKAIGLAFQVQDDILDITSDTQTLGKTGGKDEQDNKPTYVSLLGLDDARKKAQELVDEAVQALDGFAEEADRLRQLAHYIIARQH